MSKPFFEAIPSLEVSEELRALLELTTVDKVKVTKDRTSIRIYLTSPRLISKRNIFNLEGQIRSQLFPDYGMSVKLIEKYELSAQYTPRKLWELYYDSIVLELRSYSLVLCNLLKNAQAKFMEEHVLSLELEDNIVTRQRQGELKEILEKIFNERCGFSMEVRLSHMEFCAKEPDTSGERMIEAMTQAIISRSSFGCKNGEPEEEGYGESEEGQSQARKAPVNGSETSSVSRKTMDAAGQSRASGKSRTGGQNGGALAGNTGGGKKSEKGNPKGGQAGDGWGGKKGGFSRGGDRKDFFRHKANNPDVLWGRDFDDEATELSTVIGEMGEIAVNGKVITLDKRELRSGNYMMIFDVTDFTDTITVKMFVRTENME